MLQLTDSIVDGRLAILITIPYHVRSAEELWRRYRGEADVSIRGHPAVAKRLQDRTGFRPIEPGAELPAGVSAHPIGKPRRQEMPLYIPSHRALAFGDAVVEVGGELKVWSTDHVDERRVRFHRERFNPTLEPVLELDEERVLVTHGRPVLEGGRDELRAALKARPWYHRG